MAEAVDLRRHVEKFPNFKVFLAPNTSDEEVVSKGKNSLLSCGIALERVQINYDIQLLEPGDLYASYEPPDLVIRLVHEKKVSGLAKMKSLAMLKL